MEAHPKDARWFGKILCSKNAFHTDDCVVVLTQRYPEWSYNNEDFSMIMNENMKGVEISESSESEEYVDERSAAGDRQFHLDEVAKQAMEKKQFDDVSVTTVLSTFNCLFKVLCTFPSRFPPRAQAP